MLLSVVCTVINNDTRASDRMRWCGSAYFAYFLILHILGTMEGRAKDNTIKLLGKRKNILQFQSMGCSHGFGLWGLPVCDLLAE